MNTQTGDLNILSSKTNSWDRLVDFFENDPQIKPYYDAVKEEFIQVNSQSMPSAMIVTIERLLDKLDKLTSEIAYYEDPRRAG